MTQRAPATLGHELPAPTSAEETSEQDGAEAVERAVSARARARLALPQAPGLQAEDAATEEDEEGEPVLRVGHPQRAVGR